MFGLYSPCLLRSHRRSRAQRSRVYLQIIVELIKLRLSVTDDTLLLDRIITLYFFLFRVRCFSAFSTSFSSTGRPFLLLTLSIQSFAPFGSEASSP